ncbi:MAG: hypothetical protein QOE79_1383 [Sphingomonadales bacterium]|nr:hypothetical protein [Sphingomonadales bacterium]
MSLRPNSFVRGLAAVSLLAAASAAAADILVVRSIGPSSASYPPGKRLPDNARLTLQAADQLMVLDGRGTRMLRGPGTFTAGTAPRQVASAQPALQRRARIGAVRGVEGGLLRPPSLWHADIGQDETFCLADPAALTLWRRDTNVALPLTVTRESDGASGRAVFEAGASTAAWPADLIPADGARYRLSQPGGTHPTRITFRALGRTPSALQDLASSLIAAGCTSQLDLLVETVRAPDRAPRG